MAGLEFGTDGIRGEANVTLTPDLCLRLGRAAARSLAVEDKPFLIGRDTRLSGPMLQAALTAGLNSEGADVVDLGVLPTPAVAFYAAQQGMPAAMVSASHNPFSDNGVKLFAAGGKKLSDEVEARIGEGLAGEAATGPAGEGIGLPVNLRDAGGYAEHVVSAARPLDGLKVVIDCAHGAASHVAPEVLRSLGVQLTVLNDAPDGRNINRECGSTHPEGLCAAVVETGADVGLAFDGDADRVLAVDEHGRLIDGDHLIALLAYDAHSRQELKDDTVVVTVMSNLGLRLALEEAGITVHETKVGDRYVLEALNANGWSLGGEQSGHVIVPAHSTTGDGLLTGAKVLGLVVGSGQTFGDMASRAMTRLPQVLRNVRVTDVSGLRGAASIWDEVEKSAQALGQDGRVVLRPSGTEPLVRVMVEARDQARAESICGHLCEVVKRELGAA